MARLKRREKTASVAVVDGSRQARRRRSIALVLCILVVAAGLVSARFVVPLHAQAPRVAVATFHGADTNQVQQAVNAVKLQQKANWCGVAAIAWVAYYRGNHSITQQQVADYLNSSAAVSPWGTPSKDPYSGGPGFAADISRDSGTDPRSHAAGLAYAAQGTYSQVVALGSARDATNHLIADVVQSGQPLAVIVDHGLHTVLVSGVYATVNPVTDPGSVTSLVVWDPGNPASASNIQSTTKAVVSISTWLTNSIYWGRSYDSNPILDGKIVLDPDPAVGPYTYNPSKNDFAHLWIGHYVYIRPGGASTDWAFDQSGNLIKGWHGEVPSGYTGPTTTLANKITLSDTTVDAPGFWARGADASSASGPASVLAWAGTDSGHYIRVSTSSDGFRYGNKITLPASTLQRPSVTVVQEQGVSVVAVAWVGTDSTHTINVLYDVYHVLHLAPVRLTAPPPRFTNPYPPMASPYPPTLAAFHGRLWLAWAGPDPQHTIHVLQFGLSGRFPWRAKVLAGTSTSAAPTLIPDAASDQLLLAWQDASTSRLMVAQSPDGTTWTTLPAIAQSSHLAPDLAAIAPPPDGMAPYQWAWVVSSSDRAIKLMQGATLSNWQPVLTLRESSPFAPSLGYAGQPHEVIVVWAGTDSAHHLNVASIPV